MVVFPKQLFWSTRLITIINYRFPLINATEAHQKAVMPMDVKGRKGIQNMVMSCLTGSIIPFLSYYRKLNKHPLFWQIHLKTEKSTAFHKVRLIAETCLFSKEGRHTRYGHRDKKAGQEGLPLILDN